MRERARFRVAELSRWQSELILLSGDPLARTGLTLLLRDQEGVTVSGQVAPDDDWPAPGEDAAPNVAVWDLDLRSGLEDLRSLGAAGPPMVAIVADEADAREALAAGARCGRLLRGPWRPLVDGVMCRESALTLSSRRPSPPPPEPGCERRAM